MSYNILSDLLKDKIVAIVGPAKYMMSSNLGDEIDKCDTVIRINRSYESIDSYSKDIGSRTDILYSCLIEKSANDVIAEKKFITSDIGGNSSTQDMGEEIIRKLEGNSI